MVFRPVSLEVLIEVNKLIFKDVTKGDSHKLMLARLDWELEQRKK